MELTLNHGIIVSLVLFSIGAIGVLVRRNLLVMMMSIELMIASANLTLVAFARWEMAPQGQAIALFVIALSAAGVAVGLGLVIAAYRNRHSVLSDDFTLLKG